MISVIIPCRNESHSIERLLDALLEQSVKDFDVIIVDGDSNDGTQEIVQRYAAQHDLRLTLLNNPQKTIPSSLNLGIRESGSDAIVRLDAHSRPAPNYVEGCLLALKESGADIVGGAWDMKAGDSTVIAAAIAVAVSSPLGAGDAAYRLSFAKAGDVDTVPFGCFYRRTWESVGGYNEELLTNEDYEFYLRIRQRGGRIYFDPRIRCEYYARPTFKSLTQQYWRYGWWKAQMLRRHPRSIRARQLIPILWSALSVIILFFPPLWIMWGVYLLIILIESFRREARLGLFIACAYILIHFAWGWGAWAGLIRRSIEQ